MRHFGIIGFPLLHSFSAKYFSEKFVREGIEAEYSLYPVEKLTEEKMNEFMRSLDGMNVTMPYKQTVIQYLDRLDETAEAIGAAETRMLTLLAGVSFEMTYNAKTEFDDIHHEVAYSTRKS